MYMFPVAGRDDDPELFLFQRYLHLPLQEEGLPVGVHGEGHVALNQDGGMYFHPKIGTFWFQNHDYITRIQFLELYGTRIRLP